MTTVLTNRVAGMGHALFILYLRDACYCQMVEYMRVCEFQNSKTFERNTQTVVQVSSVADEQLVLKSKDMNC